GLLADELFAPGWLRGPELFERLFTGIVLTSGADPQASWRLFYENTLRRVDACLDAPPGYGGHGTIAGYAPIYARTESSLLPGSVLELGSCFGFLSLRLAAAGREVTATDINPGTIDVLRAVAPSLGVHLETRVADACRVPAPDGAADNVLLIHLLEHLEPDDGARALAEALRLARRRVVVATPLEDVADETWGHVRTVSLADLDAWGAATGLRYEVREHHGGWLLLDTGR
ncbi:MAG: Methyltransferase type 11, partial [Nocardioidaceae bacterium]|nr:Methyltransferase type 11 [Nocardioidaceae bacterium]